MVSNIAISIKSIYFFYCLKYKIIVLNVGFNVSNIGYMVSSIGFIVKTESNWQMITSSNIKKPQ